MDLNDLRAVVTIVSLLAFLGIVGWAWSRRNKEQFDQAALLPFTTDSQVSPGREGEVR
jgi:cytochrome c oxidase cbb3-type subunit 4